MNKILVLSMLLCCSTITISQTLVSYGNNHISKEEFLRAYNKNNTPVTDKAKSIREYLDLYTHFKLKVKAASDLKLDTLAQIKYDVENFRNQVIESYLSDDKGLQRLIDEGFKRSAVDKRAIYFSVPFAADMDSSKARLAVNEIASLLAAGNTDYAGVASSISEKFVPVKQRDLGYITAFTLPYEFENLIYETKSGAVSKPLRGKTAWHIFKVVDERPNPGKWKVAQILFSFPPDATAEVKDRIAKNAQEVYEKIQKGEDFSVLAKTYSDDRLTYLTGGEMPEFTTGKFNYEFEKEIFSLKKDGDITKPFASSFGYHIIKRIKQQPLHSGVKDETARYEMKQKILQDARINIERNKFADNLLKQSGYKKTGLVNDQDLLRYADTILKMPVEEKIKSVPIRTKPIFTLNKETFVVEDWLKFVKTYKITPEQYNGESPAELWDKYLRTAALNNYKKNLESFNADFKFQMQEFKEGNMLFEIMERNVWNKAYSDTVGLKKLYEANKQKYIWGESADVIMVNAVSHDIALNILNNFKRGKSVAEVTLLFQDEMQADSGRFELNQVPGSDKIKTPGEYSGVVQNEDGTAYFVKFIKFYPANEQRNFEEARGLVINDYQNELEQKWIAMLKKKYPVKINETTLKEISR